MHRRRSIVLLAASAFVWPLAALAAGPARRLSLLTVDRPGCPWCAAWRREILPGYAAHPIGRDLPLTIVPLEGPWPDGLALARAPSITPTFVLLDGPAEVGRIEGYPGARYFWPEIGALLARSAGEERHAS